jgi:hypothetical protein
MLPGFTAEVSNISIIKAKIKIRGSDKAAFKGDPYIGPARSAVYTENSNMVSDVTTGENIIPTQPVDLPTWCRGCSECDPRTCTKECMVWRPGPKECASHVERCYDAAGCWWSSPSTYTCCYCDTDLCTSTTYN